jgi:hypothetical protein
MQILFKPWQISVSIPPIYAVESSRLSESVETAIRQFDDCVGSILSEIGYADFQSVRQIVTPIPRKFKESI